jgi:hypothetical protein
MEIKIQTISEAANQALEQTAAAKAMRNLGRNQKLRELQAEFDSLEPGTDPAMPESLNRLAQQIREAYAEIEALTPEQIGSPEHKLALDCLRALNMEYNFQSDILAVGNV